MGRLLTIVLVLAAAAGASATPAGAQSVGFTDELLDARDAGLAAGAGAQVARVPMCWCDEPVKGAPISAGFDARYQRLKEAGLKPPSSGRARFLRICTAPSTPSRTSRCSSSSGSST